MEENLLVAPTPTIDPVMVWVVLTGTPKNEAVNIDMAPALSAINPPTGFNFVILDPIVLTILYPPNKVPSAIAPLDARITHKGT